MYEKLEACPTCKNTQFSNYLICTDHCVSEESFALIKCSKCELVFTNPRPTEDKLPGYYQSEEYISHTNKATSPINLIYKIVRNYTLKQKLKLLNSLSDKGTILDYGCGTGNFLHTCKQSGWNTYGYEPDTKAKSLAIENDIQIVNSLKEIHQEIDVISAWHVIEHVNKLRETLKKLRSLLKKGGFMIIAVPNIQSLDAKHYREYWAAYDVPRHLYHFSQQSFGKLIAKSKLSLVDTLPMKFDAYYVSMLSERYKTGKNNYLKAIDIARRSNTEAIKTGEYSSLIYILQK